jgi:hypothetical protein
VSFLLDTAAVVFFMIFICYAVIWFGSPHLFVFGFWPLLHKYCSVLAGGNTNFDDF